MTVMKCRERKLITKKQDQNPQKSKKRKVGKEWGTKKGDALWLAEEAFRSSQVTDFKGLVALSVSVL